MIPTPVRKYVADTFANVVYWDAAWLVVFVVTGLTLKQIIESELLGTCLAILIARPYGIFLDRVRRAFGV